MIYNCLHKAINNSNNSKMSLGGQRRTLEVACGFVIRGHPTEVNSKYKRHSRVCKKCIEIRGEDKPSVLPDFSSASGSVNGWNGIKHTGLVDNMVSQVMINGVIKSVSVPTHNIQYAIDSDLLTMNLLEQQRENEKRDLISEILVLQLSAPCPVYRYIGNMNDLPFSKLEVIHSVILKQIADFKNKK